MKADYVCDGQMNLFEWLHQQAMPLQEESPILLHPGDKVYLVVRGDIEEHTVLDRTWSLSGGNRGYALDDYTTWNDRIGITTFTSYEDAEKAANEYITTNATDVILAKDIKPVKVVAYSHAGYEDDVINYYAILEDGNIYYRYGSLYEHIGIDTEIKKFEKDMADTIKNHKDITILEDYKPIFKNMYKVDKKDNWLYAAARYQYYHL